MTGRPAEENEDCEITPEMLQAGAEILLGEFGGGDLFVSSSPAELAERIYLAMREMEIQ